MTSVHDQSSTTSIPTDIFAMFAQELREINETADTTPYNYCIDCKTPMRISAEEYICETCGYTTPYNNVHTDYTNTGSSSIKCSHGAHKGRHYNMTPADYTKVQLKSTMDLLARNASEYTGPSIPHDVLSASAQQYNRVQQLSQAQISLDSNRDDKKFVSRGDIKDEIIAFFISNNCLKNNIWRKASDISKFMKLPNGFSRGESIVRQLAAKGLIEIYQDEYGSEIFTNKYFESLGLDDDEIGHKFVREIIDISYDHYICHESVIISRVVGAIWAYLRKRYPKITCEMLEAAADGTKKTTFMKFYNAIFEYDVFQPVYIKYGFEWRK